MTMTHSASRYSRAVAVTEQAEDADGEAGHALSHLPPPPVGRSDQAE
jgi:hypothetical protein